MNEVKGMDSLHIMLSICIGLLITYLCIYLLEPVASHIGLVDMPGGRKKHAQATPLIGGISIFIGFMFALLCLNISLGPYRGLFAGSAILILLGVLDDFHELSPRIRLIGQCVASLLLIRWGNASLNHLGNLFFLGPVNLGVWSVIVTIFFVVAFINAVNMIDGCDGLAGLTIFTQALFFMYLCFKYHEQNAFFILAIFVAVLCVFLLFNMPVPWRKRASIFMGDAGSMFLGFLIAWFAGYLSQVVLTHQHMGFNYNLMTILWVIAYPLFDLASVIFHRLGKGKSPFLASRDHLHFILLDNGISRKWVTFILVLLSSFFGIVGIGLSHLRYSEADQMPSFLFVFIMYFAMTYVLRKKVCSNEVIGSASR